MRSIIIIMFIIIINFITLSALASDDNIGYSKITPASPWYFLKAIREKVELHFAQTDKVKTLRELEFAFRRLREARTLIGNREDLIPPTLEKYTYQLELLTDKHRKDEETEVKMTNNLAIHLKVLQNMYQDGKTLRAKMFIRTVLYKLIQRRDVQSMAKLPVCNLFAKEATAAALNQTEQLVLKNRAQDCFNGLTVGTTSDKI